MCWAALTGCGGADDGAIESGEPIEVGGSDGDSPTDGQPDGSFADVDDHEDATLSTEVIEPHGDVAASDDTSDPNAFPYLVVDPTELTFGAHPVGSVATLPVSLENAGTAAVTLSSVAFVEGSGAFGTNLQSIILPPGETREVFVTFYASVEGVWVDTLRLTSNARNGASIDITVAGTAEALQCEDSDNDLHGKNCPEGPDCNDSDPLVYVGAPERCNGLDDDCDGLHDEDFVGLGQSCLAGFGACATDGFKVCAADEATLACSVNPVTGGSELCNAVDDDCDGATDEDFPSLGTLCQVGTGACAAVDKFVCTEDGTALVCNVSPGVPTEEVCFGLIDNDCDGITDEGELEVCDDGIDNDCDGETDESGGAWGELFFARNYFGGTVYVHPANGDGTFGDPSVLEFPDEAFYGVAGVGDFDNDQFLDLVVYRYETAGKQACVTNEDCPSGHRCWASTCRALCTTDEQCDTDYGESCIDTASNVVANDTFCITGPSYYLARSGCEGDITVEWMFDLEPGQGVRAIIDADGNGQLDFVATNHWAEKSAFTILNDGQGGFTTVNPSIDLTPVFNYQYGIAKTSKDLNGDGIVDLIGWQFTSGGSPPTTLFFIEGLGDGSFAAPVPTTTNIPKPANMVTANDFDGDGDQDILAGLDDDGQPGAVWMMLNLEADDATDWVSPYEVFDVVPLWNSGGEHPGMGNGTSYDFNGDNRPDSLVVWTPEECGSYVWGCPQITDANHPCFGGSCRKVGYVENRTGNACPPGSICTDGACVGGCTPDCTGKQCGSDGCGGSCGECLGGQLCANGQCVVDCIPQCGGKNCGDNGCGGSCGSCSASESCLSGQCTTGCVPSCSGKQCGDDGCGGTCVVFADPVTLSYDNKGTLSIEAPTNAPPTVPALAVQPPAPTTDDALECALVVPSYDLDPVSYRVRWYRDGVFMAPLGEVWTVPSGWTSAGDVWECRVRANDGIEWSVEAQAISAMIEATP